MSSEARGIRSHCNWGYRQMWTSRCECWELNSGSLIQHYMLEICPASLQSGSRTPDFEIFLLAEVSQDIWLYLDTQPLALSGPWPILSESPGLSTRIGLKSYWIHCPVSAFAVSWFNLWLAQVNFHFCSAYEVSLDCREHLDISDVRTLASLPLVPESENPHIWIWVQHRVLKNAE